MTIVHIEDFFHPSAGYQVNILSKYQAKSGHKVYVVTSEFALMSSELKNFFGTENIQSLDEEFYEKYKVKIIRIPLIAYISSRSIYDRRIYGIVDRLMPDILYVHGNDTYIGIRYALKAKNLKYPLISDNHMLKMASKNRLSGVFHFIYRYFITPFIVALSVLVIRMSDDDYIIKYYGIPKELSPIIGFGSDLLVFHPDVTMREKGREELHISQESFVVVYAGKLDASKGIDFFARTILEKFNVQKNVVFLIIGNLIGEYGEKIQRLLGKSGNTIILKPTQKYEELAKYYQMADIAVFPKQCSLSYFDVQACGLPILVEENDINLKRITHGNGMIFKPGNSEDLRSKLYEYFNMPSEMLEKMRKDSMDFVVENYDYGNICAQYMKIMEDQFYNYRKKTNTKSLR